jgi:hypothetical protein
MEGKSGKPSQENGSADRKALCLPSGGEHVRVVVSTIDDTQLIQPITEIVHGTLGTLCNNGNPVVLNISFTDAECNIFAYVL